MYIIFLFQDQHAKMGYMCNKYEPFCYTSNRRNPNILKADLTTAKTIHRIEIQVAMHPNRIVGRQFRAGNNSNLLQNQIVGNIEEFPGAWSFYKIDIDPPIVARYVGVTRSDYGRISICEIMVY